jgi:hypothetical protein
MVGLFAALTNPPYLFAMLLYVLIDNHRLFPITLFENTYAPPMVFQSILHSYLVPSDIRFRVKGVNIFNVRRKKTRQILQLII